MPPNSFLDSVRWSHLAVLGVLILFLPIQESIGQVRWQRTVKVIAPVQEGLVTRALTDSVVAMAEAGKLQIRRRPKSDTTVPLSEIKEALSKEGLALSSATHVFLTYRFVLRGNALERDIRNLHFIYRPAAEQGEDIPILYLDLTKNDLYQRLLVEKGLPSPVNEVAFHPFAERVAFHSLQDTARVVQVGGEIIRDSERAAAEKRKIMDTIQQLTYN